MLVALVVEEVVQDHHQVEEAVVVNHNVDLLDDGVDHQDEQVAHVPRVVVAAAAGRLFEAAKGFEALQVVADLLLVLLVRHDLQLAAELFNDLLDIDAAQVLGEGVVDLDDEAEGDEVLDDVRDVVDV